MDSTSPSSMQSILVNNPLGTLKRHHESNNSFLKQETMSPLGSMNVRYPNSKVTTSMKDQTVDWKKLQKKYGKKIKVFVS